MKNHSVVTQTELSIDELKQDGGNINKPTGGFPPIYICEEITDSVDDAILFKDQDEKKTRQYATHKNAVSIKDIMEQRKTIVPFLPTV